MPRVDRSEWAPIAVELGARIRNAREQAELSQEQLAEAAGLHRNQIQNIENSRNNAKDETGRPGPGNPGIETMWAIAQALGVPLTELLPPGLGGPRS